MASTWEEVMVDTAAAAAAAAAVAMVGVVWAAAAKSTSPTFVPVSQVPAGASSIRL